jgi:hypothetical protein
VTRGVHVISHPLSFHNEAAYQGKCAVCGRQDGPWHAHHVVYQQHLRRAGWPEYDTRLALRVCDFDPAQPDREHCHHNHHHGTRRIKGEELTADSLAAMVDALGPGAAEVYLARYYDAPDAAAVLAPYITPLAA